MPDDWNGTTTGPAGHTRGSREYRRLLLALFGAGIATFAQLYSPQGVLPTMAGDLDVTPAEAALSVSMATTGLALSVLPWSWLADRIGRVKAMKIALLTASALGLLMPLSPDLPILLTIRILEGVALGGLPAIAVTYLHEEVHRVHAAAAAGTYIAGTTVGGLVGRVVAGPVTDLAGWRAGTATVAVIACVAASLFFRMVPRSMQFEAGHGKTARDVGRAVRTHVTTPGLVALYVATFLLTGGFVAVYNYLGFRLEDAPYDLPTSLTSLLFLAYLAGTVSSNTAGRLTERLGRGLVLGVAIAVMVGGVLLTLATWLPVILVGLVTLTGGYFAAHATMSSWVGARAVRDRAQATSLYNLFYYAGSSLFGWVGGFALAAGGWTGTATLVVVLAVAAGLITVLTAVGGRDSRRR